MRRWHSNVALLVLLTTAANAIAAPTTTAARGEKPRERIGQEGCVRDECHASVRAYAVMHGPVSANTCDACHELADAESHAFRFIREKAEMCTFCHEDNSSTMPVVHKPVKLGECLGCHDPHGGNNKSLIREQTTAELCHRCHESMTRDRPVLHTPVNDGACDSCHPPHGSRFPKLLDVAGPDLCLACHEGFEASLKQAKFTHKALENGCQKCHDVHGSKHAMATTQPARQQCAGCHEKVVGDAMAARYPHTPMSDERSCVNCHTPHGGSLAKLVSDVPEKLCMTCHDKDQKTARGYVVHAVSELTQPDVHKHGGIRDGTCGGCHNAHGSNQQLYLSKHYSKIFYQTFKPQQYELCFSCHDVKLVTEPKTDKLTAFRNGEQNLHTLHVRDTAERGENCRNCHNNHASGNQRLIRDTIGYGTWKMPVRFEKTGTGGSCYPGCHPRYGYDRKQSIKNTIGKPTTLPTIARVEVERPAAIEMSATDVNGATVRIPDASRVTVIQLSRTDQPRELQETLKVVRAATEKSDARIIIMLTGPDAATLGQSLASSRKICVIPDPNGAMCADLDVRVFPTTLVLRPDGLEIARLSSTVETLALKLPTYIDLAAGKLDQASATTRMTMHETVGDTRAIRDVRAIERLLKAGKPEEAIRLLMNLPENSIPNWQHNLLGARALMAMNRWTEAKNAALAAVKQNPALTEAHFVLGQIYEQAKDWQSAVAEYRAAHQK